jgi:hypothetical protein
MDNELASLGTQVENISKNLKKAGDFKRGEKLALLAYQLENFWETNNAQTNSQSQIQSMDNLGSESKAV